MSAVDLDLPVKPVTEVLKPVTDRVTREPSEHPDRTPKESTAHPVTRAHAGARHRERTGAD